MDERYYPPLFLTGNLPRPHPDEIVWLILCAGRLGFEIPKEILEMIYERLRVVKFVKFENLNWVNFDRNGHETIDFAIMRPKIKGRIRFNNVSCDVEAGEEYIFHIGIIGYATIQFAYMGEYQGTGIEIEYWTFDRRAKVYWYYLEIREALNDIIGDHRIPYLLVNRRRYVNNEITRLTRSTNPEAQKYIDLCLRYGFLTLSDPLKASDCLYVDENGEECKP